MKRIILIFAVVAGVASCYKEDKITSELGTPPYTIEDSSDPALHFIYQFNQSTGVFILADYQEVDYKWDINTLSGNVLVKPSAEVIDEGVDYLKSVLLDCYDTEFAKKYFPLKILLAEKVTNNLSKDEDMATASGRSYLAVGRIRQDCFPVSEDNIKIMRGKINAELWANVICQNSLVEIPEAFYEPSKQYYGLNIRNVEGADPKDPDALKKLGLWFYDENGVYENEMLPTSVGDVSDFVEMIVTHSTEEMLAEMEGFDILKIKYDVLIKGVKDATGVDLQAIGDKFAKDL